MILFARWTQRHGEGAMSIGMRGVVAVVVVAAFMGGAGRADELSIVGIYVQNAACKGDGTDPAGKVVRITETDVSSSFGTCKFVKKEHAGNTLAAQMSCDGPGGNVLLGDVRFTLRSDRNIDFVDQDNTYKSVLYRCPSTAAQTH
jgi:hypothetical protein